ncbi:MAG: hypothetical protein V3V03_08420 [Hyphomonadaceae bacterium]
MTLITVTPPSGEPVPLGAVKEYLRIGHDGEDGLAADLLASARAQIETEAGIALVTRTLRFTLPNWPSMLHGRGSVLRPGPVTALAAVRSVDANAVTTDLTANFMLEGGRLCLRPWSFAPPVPAGGHIEIDFETGFGPASAVPEDLQLAVKMLAAHNYQRRDGSFGSAPDGLPSDVTQTLSKYREVRL